MEYILIWLRDAVGQDFFIRNIDPILFFIPELISNHYFSQYNPNEGIYQIETKIFNYSIFSGVILFSLFLFLSIYSIKKKIKYTLPLSILLCTWGFFSVLGAFTPHSLVMCLPKTIAQAKINKAEEEKLINDAPTSFRSSEELHILWKESAKNSSEIINQSNLKTQQLLNSLKNERKLYE